MVYQEVPNDQLEDATRANAEDLLRTLHTARISGWSGWNPTQILLNFSQRHPELKTQLFRFVDVLPSLKTKQDICRHLRNYFSLEHMPSWIRHGVKLSQLPIGDALCAWAVQFGVRQMARQFIVGESHDAAMTQLKANWRQGMAFTADLLGEAALSYDESAEYQIRYQNLLENLAVDVCDFPAVPILESNGKMELPRVNVSIKCSSLYPRMDPLAFDESVEQLKMRLRPLLRMAVQKKSFVNFDMEQNDFRTIIMKVFSDLCLEAEFSTYRHFGIVVQAYLRSAHSDLEELKRLAERRQAPVTVRLVKGAYWDYEVVQSKLRGLLPPVFLKKEHTDANYEFCSRYLLAAHPHLEAAFGTHNLRSIAHALTAAKQNGLELSQFEFQMLYGMADDAKHELVRRGYRMRIYAPIGDLLLGMAYLVRRLLENSSNESFLLYQSLPIDEALKMAAKPLAEQNVSQPHFGNLSNVTTFQNDALRDYSQASQRNWIPEAVQKKHSELPHVILPVINGDAVEVEDYYLHHNPSCFREVVTRVGLSQSKHVDLAVQCAQTAKRTWMRTKPSERVTILYAVVDQLIQKRDDLIALIMIETGKNAREAEADFCEAVDFCRYYAKEMTQLVGRSSVISLTGELNEYFYRPRGLTAVIAPWNFPLAILCGMTVAALVAGNPVILKPAEQSSAIACEFFHVLHNAGVPAEAVQFLPGLGEEIGRALVAHPEVHVIAFTGSKEVGLEILSTAAQVVPGQKHIKKVIAEMGGKNAVIIDSDADLDDAVAGCLQSAFGYQGQKCSALSRIIVVDEVADRFLQRFAAALQTLKPGAVDDPSANLGAVIDADAHAKMELILKQHAASIFAQRAIPVELKHDGYFIPPTIFVTHDPNSTLMQQEFFAPFVTVFRAADFSAAIVHANACDYALTGGVYSRNPANIEYAKREFECGNLYINRGITGALVGRQPFGGFKLSGVGAKAGGPDYLLQFVEAICVTENTMRHGIVEQNEEKQSV